MAKKLVKPAGNGSYLEGRPSHLVLFREPSAKAVSVMSKVMGTGEAKGVSARATCTVLASTDHVHTRIYTRLGVAVGDLNPDEVAELRKNDNVEAVIPNEIRHIPEPPQGDFELAPPPNQDLFVAYLQGMRDAVDAMLRQVGSLSSQPVPLLPFAPAAVAPQPLRDDPNFSWCLTMIGMSPNYQIATGAGIVLAVLDTGIDLQHPDFQGRIVEGTTGRSFISGEGVQDGNGHGTHCAGVAAGPRVSAGRLRYSVAPDATLVVGKVLSNAGSGYDDQILDGIDWAATDMGAQVISMSLSSSRSAGQAYSAPYERLAERLMTQGVLLIAAAGNSSNRPFRTSAVENPAACPSIMAVAAVDRQRRVANFSCAQLDSIGTLDIAAPGVAVHSSWTGGGFRTISGTSMATPHVAGVAALFMERNPTVPAQGIWNMLLGEAGSLGLPAEDVGRGLVQVPKS